MRKPKRLDITAAANGNESKSTAMEASAVTAEHRNLACAIIKELPSLDSPDSFPSPDNIACITQQTLSTILNSGTTSNLIMDRSTFWDYSESSSVTVKTVNHGKLSTFGRGTCMTDLMLNNQTFRVTFTDCLHAPGAMINLLSIGHMLKKKWLCIFKHSPARCQLKYYGELLGEVPMIGNHFFLNLKFVRLNSSSLPHSPCEISAFAHSPLLWDLWHTHMGHPSGDTVKHLAKAATGIKVESSAPLQQCESCIMAKHPQKPFPPSDSPHTTYMLDFIHSDLCGPFPVTMPHAKLHFMVFLDDHMNLLNPQLLATKDQALNMWHIIKT